MTATAEASAITTQVNRGLGGAPVKDDCDGPDPDKDSETLGMTRLVRALMAVVLNGAKRARLLAAEAVLLLLRRGSAGADGPPYIPGEATGLQVHAEVTNWLVRVMDGSEPISLWQSQLVAETILQVVPDLDLLRALLNRVATRHSHIRDNAQRILTTLVDTCAGHIMSMSEEPVANPTVEGQHQEHGPSARPSGCQGQVQVEAMPATHEDREKAQRVLGVLVHKLLSTSGESQAVLAAALGKVSTRCLWCHILPLMSCSAERAQQEKPSLLLVRGLSCLWLENRRQGDRQLVQGSLKFLAEGTAAKEQLGAPLLQGPARGSGIIQELTRGTEVDVELVLQCLQGYAASLSTSSQWLDFMELLLSSLWDHPSSAGLVRALSSISLELKDVVGCAVTSSVQQRLLHLRLAQSSSGQACLLAGRERLQGEEEEEEGSLTSQLYDDLAPLLVLRVLPQSVYEVVEDDALYGAGGGKGMAAGAASGSDPREVDTGVCIMGLLLRQVTDTKKDKTLRKVTAEVLGRMSPSMLLPPVMHLLLQGVLGGDGDGIRSALAVVCTVIRARGRSVLTLPLPDFTTGSDSATLKRSVITMHIPSSEANPDLASWSVGSHLCWASFYVLSWTLDQDVSSVTPLLGAGDTKMEGIELEKCQLAAMDTLSLLVKLHLEEVSSSDNKQPSMASGAKAFWQAVSEDLPRTSVDFLCGRLPFVPLPLVSAGNQLEARGAGTSRGSSFSAEPRSNGVGSHLSQRQDVHIETLCPPIPTGKHAVFPPKVFKVPLSVQLCTANVLIMCSGRLDSSVHLRYVDLVVPNVLKAAQHCEEVSLLVAFCHVLFTAAHHMSAAIGEYCPSLVHLMESLLSKQVVEQPVLVAVCKVLTALLKNESTEVVMPVVARLEILLQLINTAAGSCDNALVVDLLSVLRMMIGS